MKKTIRLLSLALATAFMAVLLTACGGTASIPASAKEFNGHHYAIYKVTDDKITWEDAELYCELKGGHMAVIESQAENDFLYQLVLASGHKSAYFGYTDRVVEGVWRWVNGSKSTYTNWHPGEPNSESSTEDYAMFYWKYEDGTWNDGNFGQGTSGDERVYICEWDY